MTPANKLALAAVAALTALGVVIALAGEVFGGVYLLLWGLFGIGVIVYSERRRRSRGAHPASFRGPLVLGLASVVLGGVVVVAEGATGIAIGFVGGGVGLTLAALLAQRKTARADAVQTSDRVSDS